VILHDDHHVWDGSSQRALCIFVTFCTHGRRRFLASDEVHAAFVLFGKHAEDNFNVAVGRYVIMPDHVHLFVCGDYNFKLGPMDRRIKTSASEVRHVVPNKRTDMERRIFDHVLRSNESYSQKWNYFRENPVRAGLVKSAADWPYQGEIAYIDRA
jgi:putative transposase